MVLHARTWLDFRYKLSGVQDIKSPELLVYSVQKQRSVVLLLNVSGV